MSVQLLLVLAAAAAAPAAGGLASLLTGPGQFLPLIAIMVLFYVMILMPQQRRQKQHQSKIAAVKRGDTVVMSSGVKGKVVRVEETEVGVEIAQNVTVKVVKSMLADVIARGEPAAANDSKA
ncbi:MAG TPA: preprotein translocase subunit YajC [Caulobacteraceae bacterium]|jgi:preprotein translocase subunit YajC|nr:preprotein translocase subunit YajC [Caulobacteraceae bacterium]